MIFKLLLIATLVLDGGVSNTQGRIGIQDVRSSGLITKVIKDSPADKAGLKVGDTIVSADEVKGVSCVRGEVGTKAHLVVERKGKVFTVDVPRIEEKDL